MTKDTHLYYLDWSRKKRIETFKPLINNGESAATGLSKKKKKFTKETHLCSAEFG